MQTRAGNQDFAVGLGLFRDPGMRIFVSWGKQGLGLWLLLSLCPQPFICNFIILAQIISGAAFKKKGIFFFSVSATWKEHPSFVRM